MARDSSVLTSHQPTAIAPASVHIAHVQLRDLIICPRERGIVNYVQQKAIVEQNINAPGAPTRILSHLHFTPNSLTHLPVGVNDTLIAAGGQESEIHLSLHTTSSSRSNRTRQVWEFESPLRGSINNSVLLTSLSLTRANESSVEPRVGVSNNDGSVKLYNIPMRVHNNRRKLLEVGVIKLDVPINHSSISPDGRTLLSVGDSNKVYFHRITGGAQVTFSPITTLVIPPPDSSPLGGYSTSSLAASFSAAFSSDGSKFAVASQEGAVAVWDVRGTSKPIKVFQTDKTRVPGGSTSDFIGNGGGTGWLSDDPWEWTRGNKAPGWCVRNVKFNGGDGARLGKEIMAFTEHTSFIHIVDARTFEVDETIRVPTIHKLAGSSPSRSSPASPPPGASTSRVRPIQLSRRGRVVSTGARAPRRSSAAESDTGINQDIMLTVPPTSSIRHSVSGSPSPSTSTSLPAEVIRTAAEMIGFASNSENNLEPLEELITRLRRSTSVLAPGGQSRPNRSGNTTSPSLVTDSELHAQHAQSHSSTPTSNSVVQALGDAFRVPIPGYSAPASIGDSTWRTLGFDGTTTGGGEGSGSGTRGQRGVRLGSTAPPSVPTSPPQDDEVWTGGWAQTLAAGNHDRSPVHRHDHDRHENADYGEGDDEAGGLLVIPSLGDRAVENDVHALLEVHGIASRLPNGGESSGDSGVERTARQRPRPRRMRANSYRFLEEEEEDRSTENTRDVDLDADGEVDVEVDDMNTGSSHGDYGYYPGGSSSSHRTRRRLAAGIRQGLGYAERDFGGVEEEEEQGMDDRMDVDVDVDMGGGVEEDCESEESEDEENRNSTRTRVIRQSPFAGYTHSPLSSRRYGTGSSSNAAASTISGSTGSPSSIPFPKSNTHGQNQSQNPAHNYGYGSRYGYYDDLDLAGICFDPSGERMYVAGNGFGSPPGGGNVVGAGAVVEWSVRGAEKRWWVEEEGWK